MLSRLLFSSKSGCHALYLNDDLAPVVQRMDKFIHWISLSGVQDGYPLNSYPVDKKLLQKARILRRITIRWMTNYPDSFHGDNLSVMLAC